MSTPAATKLLVFTDLHIVPEGERIIGLDPYARLLAGVRHAKAHNGDAALVLFTGDLVNSGDAESYARLREILDELALPYSLLIGNHDHRETFTRCFPETPTDEHGFVQRTLDIGGYRLILLDTVNAPPYVYPDAIGGHLCDKRLGWLERRLAEAQDRPVVVFMHHPPHATGFRAMDRVALRNEQEFYDLLSKHGNVRHIVAGHVHRTISGSCRGISFSVFKSPCHQMPLCFDLEDFAASVDEPGAYGILMLNGNGVLVHSEDFGLAEREIRSDPAVLGAVRG